MLSNTSTYAIRALIYLALYASPTSKVGIKRISEELDIPTPFLGKILQVLVKSGILDSTKGPHGGFFLNKPALDISIMEVIDLIDGVESFEQCVIRTSACSEENPCSLHHKISPYRQGMRSLLQTESIADLAGEFRSGKEKISL